jgi:hypothetical protein
LNVNGLNSQVKDTDWLNGLKTRPSNIVPTRNSFHCKHIRRLKNQWIRNDSPSKWKSNDAGLAILISDKIDLRQIQSQAPVAYTCNSSYLGD